MPDEAREAREFTHRVRALWRWWVLLEAVRHGGWLVAGLAGVFVLATLALLHPAGNAGFRPLLELGGWGAAATAGGLFFRRVSLHRPRRFARFAEERTGRTDNLWITLFEWENFPEACSGASVLFAALAERARRSLRMVRPLDLIGRRALVAPWVGASALWAGIGLSVGFFGPVFPAGTGAESGAAPYFRIHALPPAYTGLGRLDVSATSCDAQFPVGSEVFFRAFFRGQPAEAHLTDDSVPLGLLPCPDAEGCVQTSLRLDQTRNLLLHVEGRPPLRCALRAIEDHPPTVQVSETGEAAARFETGRAVSIEADDDHGLLGVTLEARIDGALRVRPLLQEGPGTRRSLTVSLLLDGRLLPLRPGDRVEYRVMASDASPAAGGQVTGSPVRTWEATSTAEATLAAMLDEEVSLLWRFVALLAAMQEAGTVPEWEKELTPLRAVTRRWRQVFDPPGRSEGRAARAVEQALLDPPETPGAALATLENLAWTWSEVVRDHVLGLVDVRRDYVESARSRLTPLLRAAEPSRDDIDLELARVRFHLARIEEIAKKYEIFLPDEGPTPRFGDATEAVSDWIERLDRGRELAAAGDWASLERLLGGLVGDTPPNPFGDAGSAGDRDWSLRVQGLQQRLRPMIDREHAILAGLEALETDEERALGHWAATNLAGVDGEIDVAIARLEAAVVRIPISTLIDDQIHTIKHYHTLAETMRIEWTARRYRPLRAALDELAGSLRVLRSDLYLNDLDVRPVQRVILKTDRLVELLERVLSYKSTILGEHGLAVLQSWQTEQELVRRGVEDVRGDVARLSRGHPEVDGVNDLLGEATLRAGEASRSLEQNRVDDGVRLGREVIELLEKAESVASAASGTMSARRRLLVRAGGHVEIAHRETSTRRLVDELAPYLRAAVPEEQRAKAERYFRFLLED